MKLAGFELPENISINGKTLKLNGAAIRTKFFINTYIIALYSENPINNEEDAIYSSIPRCLRMIITTPLATPSAVSQNIGSGLKESMTEENYNKLKPVLDEIKNIIAKTNTGFKDYIDNFYDSDKSFTYLKNGEILGKTDEDGKIFAEAIFNLYLGKKPKDIKIKKALLRKY